ncbi:hypothetical protein BC835DRAFT_150457 [Cytidiella melzeri]|nr:hypothetical protein BC835DRAFT_150457 [Cytidiella melzeri]
MTSSDDYPPEKPQHPKEYTPGGFVASNPFADQPAYVPPSGPPPAYRPGDASAYAPPQAANSEPTSLPGYQPPSGVQASSYPLSEQEQKSWVSDSKNAVPQPPRDAPSYPSPSSSSSLQAPPSGTANPSSSSSTGFRSRFLVGSSSSNELFNPPPACFTRPPPHNPLMSSPFPPCSLLSIDSRLDNGFPTIPPPSSLQPHPFIIHDVTEEDWTRLLSDVKNAGRSLSSSSSSSSNSLGPLTHLPGKKLELPPHSCPDFPSLVVGLLLRASQSVVNNSSSSNNNNNNNRNLVRDMIDHWNHVSICPILFVS